MLDSYSSSRSAKIEDTFDAFVETPVGISADTQPEASRHVYCKQIATESPPDRIFDFAVLFASAHKSQ